MQFLKTWLCLLAWAALANAAVWGGTGASEAVQETSEATPFVRVWHRARSLQPGEVVRLCFEAGRPLARAEVRGLDRVFPSYPDPDGKVWDSLVGLDLDIGPGLHVLEIRAWDPSGESATHSYTLEVRSREFPTRRLTVDEKYVNPPEGELERIRRESRRLSAIFATVSPERWWRGSFSRPVPHPASSSFGKRSILNGRPRSPHTGTDFDSDTGTPVAAPNHGIVVLAGELYYSGNTVILDHGQGLYSFFAHLSEIDVKEGSRVEREKVLGKVGATGRVTGPHLHWTVRLLRTRVDPLSLVSVLAGEGE